MKAVLRLELFGDMHQQKTRKIKFTDCISKNDLRKERALGAIFDHPERSSWCAEITGIDSTGRLKRLFLKRHVDYDNVNRAKTRGVFVEYILESDRMYEICSCIWYGRSHRYFCTVTREGDIKEINKEMVMKYAKNRIRN